MKITKTTVELDEEKLEKLMRLTGMKTRKEALDWALGEGVRMAAIHRIEESPWDADFLKNAVDPGYDVLASRASYRVKP
ncbi:MAG: type II toxin-antitoxin system VapB family antitoxin [Terrimicrobiaceae bacterium]